MNKKKKVQSIDVSKKIDDTKKEIAQLSEELTKLINSNVKDIVSDKFGETVSKDQAVNAKAQISINEIPTNDPKSNVGRSMKNSYCASIVPKNFKESAIPLPFEVSKQKKKTYDQEATKEYIKRQKAKREECRKEINSKSKIDQELKKQKLFALHQKTAAIIQRNVKQNHERSKSRVNQGEIRIDRNFTSSNKTTSIDEKPPFHNKYNERKLSPMSKCVNQKLLGTKNVDQNCTTEKMQKKTDRSIRFNKKENCAPSACSGRSNENLLKNVTFRSKHYHPAPLSKPDLDHAATKIQAMYRGYRSRKHQNITRVKAKSDCCIMTGKSPMASKETQTNLLQKLEPPSWLQFPPVDPYPCNFINTIKRKLQFVVKPTTESRDIGIQSSVIESLNRDVATVGGNIEKNQPSALNMTEKHTNIQYSQESKNLNADALQHLALFPSENIATQSASRKSKTGSESDTSKNIPEISTESGSTSGLKEKFAKGKHKNDHFLAISTDKIKNMHLRSPLEKTRESSRNKTPNSHEDNVDKTMSKKSYTFNFSDSKTDASDDEKSDAKKYVRSPRDSILSFNRSNYSTIYDGNRNDLSFETASNDEIKTENSGIAFLNKSSSSDNFQNVVHVPSQESKHSFHGIEQIDNQNTNNIPGNKKYDNVSPLELIENIEKSIDTSLISHISDKSESSHVSSHKSAYINNTKSSTKFPLVTNPKSFNIPETGSYSQKNFGKMEQKGSRTLLDSLTPKIAVLSDIQIIAPPEEPPVSDNQPNSLNAKSGNSVSTETKSSTDNKFKRKTSVNYAKQSSSVISSDKQEDTSNVSGDTYSSDFSSEPFEDNIIASSKFSQEEVLTESQQSLATITGKLPKKNINTERHFEKITLNNLNITERKDNNKQSVHNIKSSVVQTKVDKNEIHLKFEAEVHLLNDFNESLKQLMAVEKAFNTVKSKNENNSRNTSKNSTKLTLSADSRISSDLGKSLMSSINVTRGNFSENSKLLEESSVLKPWKSIEHSSGLEISNIQSSINNEDPMNTSLTSISSNVAGLMFEQLIKDEDFRIENLKTILKIREQALLDRTKGELACLEIQRKQLCETGKLQEASLVKKKQRGILMKHQQESREMQRLKQLHKLKSNQRKTILKEQRNLIKAKMMAENVMADLKIKTPRKQKSKGPMKVLKSSESIHSDTSISRKSDNEEILSITSRTRSVRLSGGGNNSNLVLNENETNVTMTEKMQDITNLERALSMRQSALMKRRKAVEDLLQKHRKLLEEEKKIRELEMAANALIMQMPTAQTISNDTNKSKLKNNTLNKLSGKKTGNFKENRFLDDKSYGLTYDKIISEAGSYIPNSQKSLLVTAHDLNDKSSSDKTNYEIESIPTNDTRTSIEKSEQIEIIGPKFSHGDKSKENSVQYSTDYEENIHTDFVITADPDESNLSSINELIEDFSRIEQGISLLSKQFETSQPMKEPVNVNESITGIGSGGSSNGNTSSILPEIIVNISERLLKPKKESIIESKDSKIDESNIESEMDTTDLIETLVSLRDEDVSDMIHAMAPSTDSETSSISEVQREYRSKNDITLSKIETENDISNESNVRNKTNISEKYKTKIEDHTMAKSSRHKAKEASNCGAIRDQVTDLLSYAESKSVQFLNKESVTDKTLLTEELVPKNTASTDRNTSELSLVSEIETNTVKSAAEEDASNKFGIANIDNENYNNTSELNRNIINTEIIKVQDSEVIEPNNSLSSTLTDTVNSNKYNFSEVEQKNNEHSSIHKENSLKLQKQKEDAEMAETNNSLSSAVTDSMNNSPYNFSLNNQIDKENSIIEGKFLLNLQKQGQDEDSDGVETNNSFSSAEANATDTSRYSFSSFKKTDSKNYSVIDEDFKTLQNAVLSFSTDVNSEGKNEVLKTTEISVPPKEATSTFTHSNASSHYSSKITSTKIIEEDSESTDTNNDNYSGISNLFVTSNRATSEINKEDHSPDSTDISEKFSSENISIPEGSPSDSSSDNYSDDFEDDKETDSQLEAQADENLRDTKQPSMKNFDSIHFETESMPDRLKKRGRQISKDEVVMVRIELPDFRSDEAKITIIDQKEENEKSESDVESKCDITVTSENFVEEPEIVDDKPTEVVESRVLNVTNSLDVHRRVSEILANTIDSQKNLKEKRVHDYYVTTYEDVTPTSSPESAPSTKTTQVTSMNIFGNEAEELLKKQLAIEQEIKHLEQQQKEQLPYLYMREIPNKPPPPYTPPISLNPAVNILPSKVEDVNEICNYSSKVLYNAYLSNNLNDVSFSETHFKSINNAKSSKECCLFVFDLCREIAKEHYKKFEKENVPSWLKIPEESRLIFGKPFDYGQLEKHINTKVKNYLGFEKPNIRESSIMKWCRKRKDHVDDILVLESQAEERDWLNYDKDELIVKNVVTNEIFDILLNDTVAVFQKIFS